MKCSSGYHHGFTEHLAKGAVPVVTNRCCSRWNINHDKTLEKGYWLCEAVGGRVLRAFVQVDAAEPHGQM